MRINTNISAMNTYSRLTSANASKSSSLAKLSSGLRINKAGDDAAGLAISEKMKNQISGLTQASRNAQDGISLIQTAEGALNETHSMLNRIRDLTLQAANETNTDDDKAAIQAEIESLTSEIDRNAKDTRFNTKALLNGTNGAGAGTEASVDNESLTALTDSGSLGDAWTTAGLDGNYSEEALLDLSDEELTSLAEAFSAQEGADAISAADIKATFVPGESASLGSTSFTFQIGANAGEQISLSISNMTAEGLGLVNDEGTSVINVTGDEVDFDALIGTLDDAISSVSTERANLGAVQNRLEHTVSNLATTKENLSEANSRIVDVDMAEEMMEFTKNNILSQAATAMLAQANSMPQSVLQLLQ